MDPAKPATSLMRYHQYRKLRRGASDSPGSGGKSSHVGIGSDSCGEGGLGRGGLGGLAGRVAPEVDASAISVGIWMGGTVVAGARAGGWEVDAVECEGMEVMRSGRVRCTVSRRSGDDEARRGCAVSVPSVLIGISEGDEAADIACGTVRGGGGDD
jgi:hypothetical protein